MHSACRHYAGTLLDDIEPLPAGNVSIIDHVYGYHVMVRGVRFEPDEILHFTHNPDPDMPWRGRGHAVLLKSVAKQLAQARKDICCTDGKPCSVVGR